MFDFIVVFVSLVSLVFEGLPGVSMLRLVRAFRVFRLFKRLASLRQIIEALELAIPGVTNAFGILLLVMAIYAIIGVSLFGEAEPKYFGTFARAMLSCFQMMTGDSWLSNIGRSVIEKTHWLSTLYFVSYFLTTALVLVNVMIAVLLDKFVTDSNDDDGDGMTAQDQQLEAMIDTMRIERTVLPRCERGVAALACFSNTVIDPIFSNAFHVKCVERFAKADWDLSRYLTPNEVVEIIADMLPERLRAFVKLQHAVDIIEIFDSESDGAMSLAECVVVPSRSSIYHNETLLLLRLAARAHSPTHTNARIRSVAPRPRSCRVSVPALVADHCDYLHLSQVY